MTYNVTIFGIHLKLNPIAFSIPFGENHWDIYWYGIILATGFLMALIYGLKNASRFGINKDKLLDGALIVTPISILCARAYYIIFDGEKITSIKEFFGFDGSSGFAGIAIYGAVIGAFVSGFAVCKLFKMKVLDVFDLVAVSFLIGQAIGRWGNFINQEAFGSLTGSSWWGMSSERTEYLLGEGLVHPCFLYESIWCAVGFFIVHKLSKKRKFSGEVFLMYLTWYGFGRGFIELLRTDSLMLGPIKVSCLLAFALFVAGLTTIIVVRKKMKPEEEYINQFTENEEENV